MRRLGPCCCARAASGHVAVALPSKAINSRRLLGDDQLGLVSLASSQRLYQLGARVALATLDLGELADQRPGAAVQIVAHGLALSVEARAGFSLLVGGDSVSTALASPRLTVAHRCISQAATHI